MGCIFKAPNDHAKMSTNLLRDFSPAVRDLVQPSVTCIDVPPCKMLSALNLCFLGVNARALHFIIKLGMKCTLISTQNAGEVG